MTKGSFVSSSPLCWNGVTELRAKLEALNGVRSGWRTVETELEHAFDGKPLAADRPLLGNMRGRLRPHTGDAPGAM